MSDVVDRIRSKGYWDVVIRPRTFREDRVPYAELDELIQQSVVRMRGWPVPFFAQNEEIRRGNDWIGQDIAAKVVGHHEAWRMHTSGQFSHLRSVGVDWRHLAKVAPSATPEEPTIEVWEVLYYLTEIFEFAARLALSAAGDSEMRLDVRLVGTKDRRLVVGQPNRMEFFTDYRASLEQIEQRVEESRESLVANPRELAVATSREIFARFGWKASFEQLSDHQRELTEDR